MPKILYGERIGKQGLLAIGCSAFVLDEATQKVLLVKRADNGRWAIPGGYMEAGESPAEAAARELLEETGLQVRIGQLAAVYGNPNMLVEYADGNKWQLTVFHFLAQKTGGELQTSDETTAVDYFTQEEITDLNMGPFDHLRIIDSLNFQGNAIVRDDYRL